jgi:TonB family protein
MLKPEPIRPNRSTFGGADSLDGEPGSNYGDSQGRGLGREAELRARNLFLVSDQTDFGGGHRRYYGNGTLSAAVITLSLLLGWLIGRAGWNMAVSQAEGQSPNVSEEVLAAAQVSPYPMAVSPRELTDHAEAADSEEASVPSSDPVPKSKVEADRAHGNLVMYDHGKVVFRATPSGVTHDRSAVSREGELTPSNQIPQTSTNNYLLTRVVPEYPEEARQKGIQGPVVMKVLVGRDGSVQDVKVISGDPELVPTAVAALRQWRFKPPLLKSNSVEFETQVTLNFSLP